MKNDLELNRIQKKAHQAEMQRKSDEYEEQVRKAEEAQKIQLYRQGFSWSFNSIVSNYNRIRR
ncbi:MAG: hypothetical protein ACSLEN_00235 [Candidatus Malihini olakiniferum]